MQSEKYVYGANEKQLHDLEYMFPQYSFKMKEKSINDNKITISDIENSEGVSIEEFCKVLNYVYAFSKNRQVALWGAGGMGLVCFNKWNDLYKDVEISYFIDKNEGISTFNDIKVLHPSDINLKDFYIVISNEKNYDEIKKELMDSGLSEMQDFIGYKTAFMDNASLFLKTFYDTPKTMEFCNRPFGYTDIINDLVYLCCPASLRFENIGELCELDFDSIWHSLRAKIIRLSIANGCYSYCDPIFCDKCHLKGEVPYKYDENRYKVKEENVPFDMMIGLDDTCNLHCKSCRREVWVEKDKNIIIKKKKMADRLLDEAASDTRNLWLAGSGEVFVSEVYKYILKDERCKKREQISILTNGVLFNKKNWDEYLNDYKKVDVIFSIDGGKKETYESLRCGGNFEQVIKNLEFAGELRKEDKISRLQINFVLQAANIKELEILAKIARKAGVDRIHVLKMYDYHILKEDEMCKILVVDEEKRTLKEEYKSLITEEILNDDIFDWSFMSDYLDREFKDSIFNSKYSLF
jgi:MoaA/NifB/PqqE/SkfB family radical SAM enzyme